MVGRQTRALSIGLQTTKPGLPGFFYVQRSVAIIKDGPQDGHQCESKGSSWPIADRWKASTFDPKADASASADFSVGHHRDVFPEPGEFVKNVVEIRGQVARYQIRRHNDVVQ
jgi:hypothetical protein